MNCRINREHFIECFIVWMLMTCSIKIERSLSGLSIFHKMPWKVDETKKNSCLIYMTATIWFCSVTENEHILHSAFTQFTNHHWGSLFSPFIFHHFKWFVGRRIVYNIPKWQSKWVTNHHSTEVRTVNLFHSNDAINCMSVWILDNFRSSFTIELWFSFHQTW